MKTTILATKIRKGGIVRFLVHTERHNLPYRAFNEKRNVDYAPSLEALYEIADAELGSFKEVHDEFHRLSIKYKTFRKSFIRSIRTKVLFINTREKFGIYEEDVTTVCNRIYEDWMEKYEPA